MPHSSSPEIAHSLLGFIWHYLKDKKRYLAGFVLVALLWAIDMSLTPYLLKVIVDNVVQYSHNQDKLLHAIIFPAILYASMSLVINLNFRLYDYVNLQLYPYLRATIEKDLLQYLLNHSYTFFHNNFSGALTKKITDLMENIEPLVTIPNEWFYPRVFAALIASGTLFTVVHPIFGIILFVWALVFVLLSYLASKRAENYSRDFSENISRLSGSVADSISNVMSVKLFDNVRHEISNIDTTLDEVVKSDRKLSWFNLKTNLLQGLGASILIGAMLLMLIWGLQEGWVSAGDFALVLTLSISFTWGVHDMGKQMQRYSKVVGTCNQALSLIRQSHEVKDQPDATLLKIHKGEIRFQEVSFHYENRAELFKNLTVSLRPGEKVGLVGYSGGGKSTFIKLILRLLDIQLGTIFIDNQDIKKVTQGSLRSQIATIPQEPELFHRTIRDNIRFARADATEEEVIDAARKAHCHDFIMDLPQKYESLVGERGVKLSGGQKQRIAIARAFLKNAPILLLDEATSSLDSQTEDDIHQALHEVMINKTVIVIAHRLSTLKEMDRILVFVDGAIVEDGALNQLLENKNGHFYKLWQMQVNGFISEIFNKD
ncbi:Putative multidrug export ATP-binding/permease protein [Legionella massiliensis]|uniref:Putative multidrug export ATP-binding/permease protein n=1 Tax=Legionella massiliensis TaxID=1034943 RepID=A0A078KU22_9GAMM|nr:ABC transporter ATP-binding protein [Legionella massiliensis]CDZ76462.1 Putative multidrug export ATP-binding/permease protein [Legionella massiliensis]CEE12200.1 Putative multidrug export ATP-binding/permease protein [Legionella massiliensis]